MSLITGYRVFNDRWGCLLRSNGSRGATLRFNSEVIVDCLHESLPGTEISFCGFHRAVAEQKLDLLKFPS